MNFSTIEGKSFLSTYFIFIYKTSSDGQQSAWRGLLSTVVVESPIIINNSITIISNEYLMMSEIKQLTKYLRNLTISYTTQQNHRRVVEERRVQCQEGGPKEGTGLCNWDRQRCRETNKLINEVITIVKVIKFCISCYVCRVFASKNYCLSL